MDIQSYQKLLINDIFKNHNIEDCQGNVSEILKTIYSQWFFYEHNFNNPIKKSVCRKIDHILPQEDGGGPVQYKFY